MPRATVASSAVTGGTTPETNKPGVHVRKDEHTNYTLNMMLTLQSERENKQSNRRLKDQDDPPRESK